MSRVYLSGAVTGVTDYKEIFARWEKVLQGHGYDVVNPVKVCESVSHWQHSVLMKICLLLLGECDRIFFIPGWEKSRGANQEYGYAAARGIKVLNYAEGCFWL